MIVMMDKEGLKGREMVKRKKLGGVEIEGRKRAFLRMTAVVVIAVVMIVMMDKEGLKGREMVRREKESFFKDDMRGAIGEIKSWKDTQRMRPEGDSYGRDRSDYRSERSDYRGGDRNGNYRNGDPKDKISDEDQELCNILNEKLSENRKRKIAEMQNEREQKRAAQADLEQLYLQCGLDGKTGKPL